MDFDPIVFELTFGSRPGFMVLIFIYFHLFTLESGPDEPFKLRSNANGKFGVYRYPDRCMIVVPEVC
jgi:hypothetical protein